MKSFLNEMAVVDRSIIDQDDTKIIQTFRYGNPSYSVNDNKLILDSLFPPFQIWHLIIWGSRLETVTFDNDLS